MGRLPWLIGPASRPRTGCFVGCPSSWKAVGRLLSWFLGLVEGLWGGCSYGCSDWWIGCGLVAPFDYSG